MIQTALAAQRERFFGFLTDHDGVHVAVAQRTLPRSTTSTSSKPPTAP